MSDLKCLLNEKCADYDKIYNKGYADAIDEFAEWCRLNHADFHYDYADDIKARFFEQLKEQK